MSEKLCLQWNDFRENVNSAFGRLRGDKEFTDVTLACEDGQQVEAHKVILVAPSPFFQRVLGRNKHPHPLIYMRGIKSVDIVAIIDFLYCGEAAVYQENLDSFLTIAEELELKGLMGKTDENLENIVEERKFSKTATAKGWSSQRIPEKKRMLNRRAVENEMDKTVAVQNHAPIDLNDLEERVQSMMEKSENNYANSNKKAHICKVCGKEGQGNDIKQHIEANHIAGISIPCDRYGFVSRSRHALQVHEYKHHRNE